VTREIALDNVALTDVEVQKEEGETLGIAYHQGGETITAADGMYQIPEVTIQSIVGLWTTVMIAEQRNFERMISRNHLSMYYLN